MNLSSFIKSIHSQILAFIFSFKIECKNTVLMYHMLESFNTPESNWGLPEGSDVQVCWRLAAVLKEKEGYSKFCTFTAACVHFELKLFTALFLKATPVLGSKTSAQHGIFTF